MARRGWVIRPYLRGRRRRILARVAVHRCRLSSTERAETLLRLLDLDDAFRASQPIGYAYARVVDIEHPDDLEPDALVEALDPCARLEGQWPDP
jgi:hypothetical protein